MRKITTHTINNDQKEIDKSRKVLSFTVKGKEDYYDDDGYPIVKDENDIRCHAKIVQTGTGLRYFVKTGKTGRLYNPIGLFDENQQNKQMRHAARPQWKMQQTKKKVFEYYLEFLKTKNPSWLHNAEREVV